MSNYSITVSDEVLEEDTSFFGHDPSLGTLVPPGGTLPAHLVLTLDRRDPRFTFLNVGGGSLVRLIHPFYYNQGERFVYRQLDESTIQFIGFSGEVWDDWPAADFPPTLPSRSIRIDQIQGAPARRLNKHGLIADYSTIFVGPGTPTVQKYDELKCEACGVGDLRLIASIPNRPIPELNIWDNDFVFVLFWSCSACQAIVTHNECD